MKIIVLAGGVGRRLWPLSRELSPKQIKPFFGTKTLLQKTIERLLKAIAAGDIFIVTGKNFYRNVIGQLPRFPKKNILIEPARKSTAPAIGLAAYTIAQKNADEIIVSIPSDHYLEPEREFLQGLKDAEKIIRKIPSAVCLMGIKPTYPETGYGYIQLGARVKVASRVSVYKIKKFIEKPHLKKAKQFLASRRYLWNPSYFAMRAGRVKELLARFSPRTHRLLLKTLAGNRGAFQKIKAEAIDYAIMEKLKEDFYVLPRRFKVWADVGHWASVKEIQGKKSAENVSLGLQHNIDTTGSLIYNYTNNILTTIGVKDLVIVQTEDGTLICHKDRAQDVKKLVEQMKKEKRLRRFV